MTDGPLAASATQRAIPFVRRSLEGILITQRSSDSGRELLGGRVDRDESPYDGLRRG